MILHVEKLSGPEALRDIEAKWASLGAAISPRTPFTSPMWFILWWEHLRRRGFLLRDEFFCHVVRDIDGRLVAIAPLMLTHVPSFGPFKMRLIQFFGADPSITEIRGIICRPEDEDAVLKKLVLHFGQRQRTWDMFRWSGLKKSPLQYSSILNPGNTKAVSTVPDYLLTLPESWETLRSSISSNTRKSVRKAYGRLAQDGHKFNFRVVDEPDQVPSALNNFFALHAERADATAFSVHHPNKFRMPNSRAFLTDYLSQSAEMKQLCVLELDIDGSVAASRLAFLLGPELYLYFTGWKPAWRKYSIMTILMSEAMKWAIERGLKIINLSTGTDQSKLRWQPSEITFYNATQYSSSLRARLLTQIYEASASRLGRAWR
jgi:CelD/BcsL family acetyltransferase involved in cellulose biosynthesis